MENRFNFLAGFEKIEVETGRRNTTNDRCWVSKDKLKFYICSQLSRELGWSANTRVNLYHKGKLGVIVPDKVGLYTVKLANSKSSTLVINCNNVCLTVLSVMRTDEYTGWIEDGVLFFKPKEEE